MKTPDSIDPLRTEGAQLRHTRKVELGYDQFGELRIGKLWPFKRGDGHTLAVLDLPEGQRLRQLVFTADQARELVTALQALLDDAGGGSR